MPKILLELYYGVYVDFCDFIVQESPNVCFESNIIQEIMCDELFSNGNLNFCISMKSSWEWILKSAADKSKSKYVHIWLFLMIQR